MSAETSGGASLPADADTDNAAAQPGAQAPASAEGFFRPDGDSLIPAAFATSPWGPVLHGRLIGGLTARGGASACRRPRAGVRPPDH